MNEHWIARAVELAVKNVEAGGGPFGAVIVRDGELIAEGVNLVTIHNDPTAHAEVMAIRRACERLSVFELQGCDLYTSCEPCPMCLGAIYWSRLAQVFYAANRHDAAAAGFDDEFIYREFAAGPAIRRVPLIVLDPGNSREPFQRWRVKSNKIPY